MSHKAKKTQHFSRGLHSNCCKIFYSTTTNSTLKQCIYFGEFNENQPIKVRVNHNHQTPFTNPPNNLPFLT